MAELLLLATLLHLWLQSPRAALVSPGPASARIAFKTDRVQDQWHKVEEAVRILVEELAGYLGGNLDELVVTGLLDSPVGSRVHLRGGAADVRTRDWPDGLAEAVEEHFNRVHAHELGDRMPVVIYETPSTHKRATGEHLHLQWPVGLPLPRRIYSRGVA